MRWRRFVATLDPLTRVAAQAALRDGAAATRRAANAAADDAETGMVLAALDGALERLAQARLLCDPTQAMTPSASRPRPWRQTCGPRCHR